MAGMQRFLPAVFIAATVALVAAPAGAGTIGFRTDAEVKAGPGADAKVTLTHTGDEAADDVMVRVELLDKAVDGEKIRSIPPGGSHVWQFHLADELPTGVYTVLIRVRYTDSNGYPFEVISTASATVGAKAAQRIFGNLQIPNLPSGGEVTATLEAKRPKERKGDFEASLAVPSGLHVTPERVVLSFSPEGKATASFRIRNLKLLTGTSVNVYGLVTGTGDGFPQTDGIRGTARIVASSSQRSGPPPFYRIAAGLFVLLIVLEGFWWITGRRKAAA
jgi:hypothetical protein